MPESRTQGSDTLRCPACDAPLKGNLGRVPASIGDGTVRVAIDCQTCVESIEMIARPSSTRWVIGDAR